MSLLNNKITYLEELESEAIFIIREAIAQFSNPCILFSGGKDSIVVCHLAAKAFHPLPFPFTILHIDTGHNFKETIEFRDAFAKSLNAKLVIGKVQDSIDQGKVTEEKGANASRNKAQSVTLLDTIRQYNFDAALGGGRRDEEKARAKERIFSHRDVTGTWQPLNQRPELWNIFNGKMNPREHFRVFPISNWTELDIWQYIKKEQINLPSLYFTHSRECVKRNHTILALSPFIELTPEEKIESLQIRFRTIGDLTITGAIESTAKNIDEVINELMLTRETERGNRADDARSETSMEDRKKEGYF